MWLQKAFSHTQQKLDIHANKECWLCGRKLATKKQTTQHEDSHLSPSTRSNSNKGICGVRCLGCYFKFTAHTKVGDCQRHKELGRCPKNQMEDPLADVTCVSAKGWEAENLEGLREGLQESCSGASQSSSVHSANNSRLPSAPSGYTSVRELRDSRKKLSYQPIRVADLCVPYPPTTCQFHDLISPVVWKCSCVTTGGSVNARSVFPPSKCLIRMLKDNVGYVEES